MVIAKVIGGLNPRFGPKLAITQQRIDGNLRVLWNRLGRSVITVHRPISDVYGDKGTESTRVRVRAEVCFKPHVRLVITMRERDNPVNRLEQNLIVPADSTVEG